MHYGGANGVKWGENRGTRYWILTPNELVLSFQAPRVCVMFHQNRIKIATGRERTATHTEVTQVILSVLCYAVAAAHAHCP